MGLNKKSKSDYLKKKFEEERGEFSNFDEDKPLKPSINSHERSKLYIGYYPRLIIRVCLTIFFFVLSGFLLYKSFRYNPDQVVSFSEKSDIDYKVYVKDNDFFETPYLEKGMVYIANLIDHIDIDFNYDFNIDERVNMEFNYNIIGKLAIEDSNGNTFFEKDYVLLEDKTSNMENSNFYNLKESVSIDYGYYNSLANSFKSSYGISTVSKLNVYLNIEKKNMNAIENLNLDENDVMLLSIPLSERSINIALDQNDINDSKSLIQKAQIVMSSREKLVCGIMAFALAIVYLVRTISLLLKLRTKKSKYDKYIDKLLVEYDRLIVETSYCPNFNGLQVVKVGSFTELLDARDNLKMPIMYYNVIAHQKCYFYILNDKVIYLVTFKAIDMK